MAPWASMYQELVPRCPPERRSAGIAATRPRTRSPRRGRRDRRAGAARRRGGRASDPRHHVIDEPPTERSGAVVDGRAEERSGASRSHPRRAPPRRRAPPGQAGVPVHGRDAGGRRERRSTRTCRTTASGRTVSRPVAAAARIVRGSGDESCSAIRAGDTGTGRAASSNLRSAGVRTASRTPRRPRRARSAGPGSVVDRPALELGLRRTRDDPRPHVEAPPPGGRGTS